MQRDSYRFHIGLFDKLLALCGSVSWAPAIDCVLTSCEWQDKNHQKFIWKIDRREDWKKCTTAIEKRGQIKDKHTHYLHVGWLSEWMRHIFTVAATAATAAASTTKLPELFGARFQWIGKNDFDDTQAVCVFFPLFRLSEKRRKKMAHSRRKKKQIKIITSQLHYKLL